VVDLGGWTCHLDQAGGNMQDTDWERYTDTVVRADEEKEIVEGEK
jgi:hypothetical protein